MKLIIQDQKEKDWARQLYNVADWRRDTLVDIVQNRARIAASSILYTLLDRDCNPVDYMTCAQLDEQASVIAAGLHHFASHRDRVLLLCENDFTYIRAFFGCLYADMIPVSGVHVDVIRSDERFETVVNDSQPHLIIGPRHVLAEYKRQYRDLDCKPVWVPLEVLQDSGDRLVLRGNNEETALIQYSSGTTSDTKGILITYRNLMYNLRHQPQTAKLLSELLDEKCNGLNWLPFSHDFGLIGGIVVPVALGRPAVLLPPKYFIEKPARWLQAMSRYRVQASCGPTFAYNLCLKEMTDEEVKKLDLASWEIAVNGADATQIEVMERFCQRFGPVGFKARNFLFGYGLAEATLAVTNTKAHTSPKIRSFSRKALMAGFVQTTMQKEDRRDMISCGSSLEDQKVMIVDPETCQPLRNGRVGEIWVSGPSVAKGYFNREEETEEVFHARFSDSSETYLRTGDLGFIYEGELYFSGRMSNVITLRNKKYDPGDISGTLENACGDLRINGSAFFLEDPEDPVSITIIAEVVRNPEQSYEQIASQIYERVTEIYDIWPRTIVLTRAGGVLKTPSGKIQIARTCKAFQEKTLPLIREFLYETPDLPPLLSFQEAYQQIEAWIGDVTRDWKENVRELTRDKLVQGKMNSDLLLDLRKQFEKRFHVEVDPSEFTVSCQTYADLCALLAKKISSPVL